MKTSNPLIPIISGAQSLANRAKTRQEVAGEYGITANTLKSQLHKNSIELPPGLIYPKTLIVIYYAFN